jgi:hypothetical protein
MDEQIVLADKRLKRRVFWLSALMIVGGAVGMASFYHQFQSILDLADRDIEAAARKALSLAKFFSWLSGLSLVGIGLWFGRLGWKIYLWDQYPPPGWKVLRDTKLRTGRRARRVANAAIVACAIFLATGICGGWLLYRMAVVALSK